MFNLTYSYTYVMPEANDRITLRPTDEDKSMLAELTSWLGLKGSQVIRLALRRLHKEESLRRESAAPGAGNTRNR